MAIYIKNRDYYDNYNAFIRGSLEVEPVYWLSIPIINLWLVTIVFTFIYPIKYLLGYKEI